MFVQFHTITGYAGVLLNRDDTGMAKRLSYGDAVRTRTSSQFAKRKIRLAEGEFAINNSDLGISVRSRETFKRLVALPLITAGYDKEAVVATTVVVMDAVFKPSEGAKKTRNEKLKLIAAGGDVNSLTLLERSEINVLSQSEITYLKDVVETCLLGKTKEEAVEAAVELCKDKEFKLNLRAVGTAMSLDVAMYGRMVTGDSLSSVDAAVSVSHALTVHSQAVETDYFTAVDDLMSGDGEQGGGHLGEVELTSPLLYAYYVLDTKQLAYNLAGIENAGEIAGVMAGKLVRLVAEHIVGAKKGSTAPYSSADLVLVEIGSSQPRTLAEAYRVPSKPNLKAAVAALEDYVAKKDRMYGSTNERLVACTLDADPVFGKQMTIMELASIVATRVAEAN
jgi:CRISPR system Cascade subunit CasC